MAEFKNQKTPEKKISVEEKMFKEYVEDLQLKPEDFNKVILDIGAGNAHFAKWAKDHNLSSKIYSLEPFQEIAEKGKGIISTAEDIPMPKDFFDLIISNAAIPNIYLGENNVVEKVKKSFSEMLRVLKNNGEIRLARVLLGNKYKPQKILTDIIKESLKKLQEKYNIQINIIRTPLNDSYEYGKNNYKKELLAESFLIILKKN